MKDMILYEDGDILVCRKPSGIPVQTARTSEKDMISILKNSLSEKKVPEIYVVHRLDQPVEGVMVFAKTKKAAAGLSRQINEGQMEKIYRAVCCAEKKDEEGKNQTWREWPEKKSFERVDYLVSDALKNISTVVSPEKQGAKRAKLTFRILERCRISDKKDLLLAEIRLETGRRHQIRVQMAYAGLPLAGDRKYFAAWKDWPGADSLALCAVSLTFFHPVTGKKLKFETRPQSAAFSFFEENAC